MSGVVTAILWAALLVGMVAACAALYGRYRTLPASWTGPGVCGLDEANGCRVLFRTRYAAILGVPNSLAGVLYYPIVAVGLLSGWSVSLLMSFASAAGALSFYLAYLLIRDNLDCRVCWAGHLANAAIWLCFALRLLGVG